MDCFYDPELTAQSNQLSLNESRHAIKSLRLKIGDKIEILNGKGLVIEGAITSTEDFTVQYQTEEIRNIPKDENALHVAISPLKQQDRFEWFVEKATELGIGRISPLRCQRTEFFKLKPERLRKISISAMKQSGNPYLPTIDEIISFEDFVGISKEANKYIAHCYEGKGMRLKDIPTDLPTVILIGPEGDFSEKELDIALDIAYNPLDLGNLTLRTETAGIVVCSHFQTQKQ